MAKIVGLTGGIGSGKTTVAKMFQQLGVPIYIADLEAKQITNLPETLKIIENQFGSSVIEKGQLNRVAMAQLVFSNEDKLKQLNAIIHPLVAKHFKEWVKKNENAVYVIKEAAILFETNGHTSCDFIITVTAPLDVRINRVQLRDHLSKEEIIRRINTQWTDEKRIILSDFVIENYSLKKTQEQVQTIHKEISKLTQ